MKYPSRVVLKLPLSQNADLSAFVEDCIVSGVVLIAVWGKNAVAIEDELDWLIIADKRPEEQWIVTTSHSAQEDALGFAERWLPEDKFAVVRL